MSETIQSVNPATEEVIGEVPVASRADVFAAVERLRAGQRAWAARPLEERTSVLAEAANRMLADAEPLAALMTREQGKPLAESRVEVPNSAERIQYYCEHAPRILAPSEETVGKIRGVTRREPVGVVGAIKPWNFPVNIPLWTIAPALIAGNAVLFKPSELTPLLGQALVDLFHAAGVPCNVLAAAHGGDETGRAVVESDVDLIGFVGSQEVGKKILHASADRLRRVALELGGKDPMVVLADADFDAAVAGAIKGKFKNCGQVCCSVERIYVEAPVYDRFVEAVTEQARKLLVGNGLEPGVQMGPLIREPFRARVGAHVDDAVRRGAKLTTGGRPRAGRGFFYEPTVLAGCPDESLMMREETFGPAAPVIRVRDADEAIERANAGPFGLTATLWTRDLARAEALSRRLQAGTVGVNQTIGSIVNFPWGGVKQSGMGRMLGSEGLLEFTNTVNYRFPA